MNQDPNIPVENPTTQPVLPPEPQAPTEEPVMMVANIDETPQAQVIPTEPVEPTTVEAPVAGPDLGQPNQPEAETETVPTFQQLGEVPIEGADPAPVTEEAPTTPPETTAPVVNPLEGMTPETEPEQVPTFQQLAEVPVETAPNPMAMEEAPTEEEEKKKPKKGKRIVTIIIVLVVLALIGGGLSFALKGLNTLGKEDLIKTLKPVRSENSRTNLVIFGTDGTKRDEVATMLNAVYGGEETNMECAELEGRYLKYQAKKLVLKTKKAYNAYIPCNTESKNRYLIDGDGNNTVDGAILVVDAAEGFLPEASNMINNLKLSGVKKVVVYVVGDKSTVESQIIETLDHYGFDTTYIPIINSAEVDEETIIKVMEQVDTTVKKVVDKKQNAAIQSFDKATVFVYMKTVDEDGVSDPITAETELSIKVDNKEIPVEVVFPEGIDSLQPGFVLTVTLKLKEAIPLQETMRLQLYQNNSVVAVAVISEL